MQAGVVALGCAVAAPAAANGRFPESNQISFSPTDPDLVLLRVTFGLLVSRDRGKTFHWVCEQSIGFSGVEDPMYAVTPSNTVIGTTFQGVTVTRDRACGWAYAGGELAQQVFIDLSANPKAPNDVVVFASSYDRQDEAGNIEFKSRVWETRDEGQTFTALPGVFDKKLLGYTIDLAASDPDRIYATAVRNPGTAPRGFFLTSRDHGTTWEEVEIPLVGTERSLFIAAVDPTDADRVYIRTSNTGDGPSRLLLREATKPIADAGSDAGPPAVTFREIFTATAALLGFALSPDGKKVYIGGPKDGLRVASTTDFSFEQRAAIEVQCLALQGDRLWACSSERSGFIAGTSTDDGRTFTSAIRFCEIGGPLDCPTGSPTSTLCNEQWPAQKAVLGCSADAAQPSSDAGGPAATPASTSSCGCQTTPAGPWGALAAGIAAITTLLRRRKRR